LHILFFVEPEPQSDELPAVLLEEFPKESGSAKAAPSTALLKVSSVLSTTSTRSTISKSGFKSKKGVNFDSQAISA